MHSEDSFALWLGIRDSIRRWRSMDGAYKIHLYDGSPNEKEIHKLINKLCDGLDKFITTERLPEKALKQATRLRKRRVIGSKKKKLNRKK